MTEVISRKKQTEIQNLLSDIENRYGIHVLHAVESGSRAWGFPSRNSDYDIRFIYCHPKDWYITVFDASDQIDLGVDGELDASGWDIKKCLQLLRKGNVALLEWLNSPVVYRTSASASQLNQFASEQFNAVAAFHHYLALAKRKLLDETVVVNAKSFLYCLRALLCARWIVERGTMPPVLFSPLVEIFLDSELRHSLEQLLVIKAVGTEEDEEPLPEQLLSFARHQYDQLSELTVTTEKRGTERDYNEFLRRFLNSTCE